MKKLISLCIAIIIMVGSLTVYAEDLPDSAAVAATGNAATIKDQVTAKGAVLMEASTGTLLFEKDKDVRLPPASVTKIMTMLLAIEAVDSGRISFDDPVTCSPEAAGMGGSQVYLEPGEVMTVRELFKAVAVASGNDAAVMLAEYIAGSEGDFVTLMNQRAQELGMANTTFMNCTGLENPEHRTTAYDVAIMSRELLSHESVLQFTTIWMDSLRGGQFTLANTNKLIRFYNGANGLKTGSTDAALFCVSATAKRDNMQLIAVILGGNTSEERFSQASKLLDFGFSKYVVASCQDDAAITPLKVEKGVKPTVPLVAVGGTTIVLEKGKEKNIEKNKTIMESIKAPVEEGTKVGEITVTLDGNIITRIPIITQEAVKRTDIFYYIASFIQNIF